MRRCAAASLPTPPSQWSHSFAEANASPLRVSPNGRYVAFLTTLGYGKVGIALMDLTTANPPEALVSAKDANIKEFFWKGDDCR